MEFLGSDCFEPNDLPEDAAPIEVGETIQAYAHAGYDNSVALGAKAYADWYSVTLEEPTNLTATLLQAPGDEHRTRIRIFDQTGTKQLANGGGTTGGELFSTTSKSFAAGTYLVVFELADAAPAKSSPTQDMPEHFVTPYKMKVSAE